MSDIREKGPFLGKIRELYQIILDRNEELITGPNGYSRAYLVAEDSTIEKFNTDVAVLHNTVGIYAAKMEEMLESFIELEVSELTSFITKLEDTVRTLKAEHLISKKTDIIEYNAVSTERGHLIEDFTPEIVLEKNTTDNYWLLTDDGYLEFHGGGSLRNSHGVIMQSYGSSTPVGSEGIEIGLMKIFNYASREGAGNNGRSVSNYKGPFDRDMIIEKILDAGLNYYFKEPEGSTEKPLDINDRKYWQWDLKENLNNNAKRRVKLPDNIFKFYQQFEPGSKRFAYVNNNPLRFIDPTVLEDENPNSVFHSYGKDWIRKTSPRVTFPKGSEQSPFTSKFSMILSVWAEREVFYNVDDEIINQIFTGKVLSELSLNFGDKWSVTAASIPDVIYHEGLNPEGNPAFTDLTVKADSFATKSKDIYGAMMDTLKNLAMGPSSGIGLVDDIFTVAGGIDAITGLNSLFGAQGAYADATVNFDFSDAATRSSDPPDLETGVKSTPNSVTVTDKKNEYLTY